MRSANKCPNCGSYVSHFAAGCAICGVPLDPRRLRRRPLLDRLRSRLGSGLSTRSREKVGVRPR